jgi:hypothetical protein
MVFGTVPASAPFPLYVTLSAGTPDPPPPDGGGSGGSATPAEALIGDKPSRRSIHKRTGIILVTFFFTIKATSRNQMISYLSEIFVAELSDVEQFFR